MMQKKAGIAGRCAKSMTGLIVGVLLTGACMAGAAFAAEAAFDSDGREVEIAYLNDASADEEVLLESASENAVMAGFSNYTSMSSESVSIEGIEDQKWTGSPVTLPDLKVIGPSIMGRAGDTSVYDPDQYTVTYANNIDPGTATVTITGAAKGAWNWNGLIGSVTRQFKIIKSGSETKPEPLPQNSITLPKGTTVTAGSGASKATYKVTGNNTVTFVKSKAGKKATSAKVPDTVSFSGMKFMVTAAGKKAFSGMSKLKKVTIGKYVTSIGANAFAGCKKMKTLVVKSTVLSASKCKKCLAGSSVKTVKVPASVKKTYKKKIFVKKVCGLKVTVK